jgi:hypothetical protein
MDGKLSKSGNHDRLSVGQGGLDQFNACVNDRCGLPLGKSYPPVDVLDNIFFVHRITT